MTTKPRRKATPKVPAKPTPIEATQVLAYLPLVLAAAVGEEVAKAARLRAYSIVDELAKRPPRGLKKRAKCALLEGELAAEEKVVAVWLQVEEWHAEPGGAPVPMGDRDWASVEYDRLAKGAASGTNSGSRRGGGCRRRCTPMRFAVARQPRVRRLARLRRIRPRARSKW